MPTILKVGDNEQKNAENNAKAEATNIVSGQIEEDESPYI